MVVRLLVLLMFVFAITSCNKSGDGGAVKVNTSGIFNPVSFWHQNEEVDITLDLGEYIKGSQAIVNTLQIKNNSAYEINNMELVFIDRENDYFDFEKVNNEAKFPGRNGTCETSLQPKESCLITIQFKANVSGRFTQKFYVAYDNLVERGRSKRELEFTILAGTPASLIFADYKTSYEFGTPLTLAQIPLVERIDPDSYEQILTIVNAGELTARDIAIVSPIAEECQMILNGDTNLPCDLNHNQSGAYLLSNVDCPDEVFDLAKDESCQVKVTFQPRNHTPIVPLDGDDIILDMKVVQYDSNFILSYIQDPELNMGSLNAYFTSTSALIEGILSVPSTFTTMNFNEIVAGNRKVMPFKINNSGYQSAGIIGFKFYSSIDNSLKATCKKEVGSNDLVCYDNTNALIIDRHIMPYTVRDTNNCISNNTNNLNFISAEASCFFDIVFQPSEGLTDRYSDGEITELENLYDFRIAVIYDSQWKGQRTERERELFDITGKGIVGAIMEFAAVQVDEDIFSLTDQGGFYKTNIGRQPVYANAYAEDIDYKISVINVGGASGSVVSIKDGATTPTTIPINNGTPTVSLGAIAPKFYNSIFASIDCANLPPVSTGVTCNISGKLKLAYGSGPGDWDEKFYDIVTGDTATSYKKFDIVYTNGSLYLDSNLTTTLTVPETSSYSLQARVFGKMIQRAVLSKLSNVSATSIDADKFRSASTIYDDGKNFRLYKMTNMGTGAPSFIRATDWTINDLNFPINGEIDRRLVKIVPFTDSDAPDLSSLGYSDCTTHVDISEIYKTRYPPTIGTDMTVAGLQAKDAGLDPLGSEETCAFLIKFDGEANFTTTIASSLLALTQGLGPFTSQGQQEQIYPRRRSVGMNPRLAIEYFDNDILLNGDPDKPILSEPLLSLYGTFGNSRTVNKLKAPLVDKIYGMQPNTQNVVFYNTGVLGVDNVSNSYSGILYKPGYTFTPPSLTPALATVLPAHVVNPTYWFRTSNYATQLVSSAYVTDPAAANSQKPKRRFSKNILEDFFTANGSPDDYDAVMYFGSFPQKAGSYSNTFNLVNAGASNVKITNIEIDDDATGRFAITSGAFPPANPGGYSQSALDALATVGGGGPASTLPNISKLMEMSFNATNSGDFFASLKVTYETKATSDLWDDPESSGTTKETRELNILLVATSVATATAPRFQANYQNWTVTQDFNIDGTTQPPLAVLTDTTRYPTPSNALSFGFNEDVTGSSEIDFTTILQTSNRVGFENKVDDKLIFTKKRIHIINPDATQQFVGYWHLKEATLINSGELAPMATPQAFIDVDANSTCITGTTTEFSKEYKITLQPSGNAGDACYIDITYQARDYNGHNVRFIMVYEHAANEWISKNFNLKFSPQAQPTLQASAYTTQQVTGAAGKNAYMVNMGTQNYSGANLIYINTTTGTETTTATAGYEPFVKYSITVPITHTIASPIRASFLATYHNWLRSKGTFTHLQNEPASYDVNNYAIIKQTFHKAANGTTNTVRPKVTVQAKKDCLVGPDSADPSIFWADRGFNSSHTGCSLKIARYFPLSYMYRTIKKDDSDMVKDSNLIELDYYSYQRSAQTVMRFFFHGNFTAPSVTKNGGYIDPMSDSTGSAGFEWNDMTVDNSFLGNLRGYRLFYHKNSSFVGINYQINPVNAFMKDVKSGTHYSNGSPYVTFNNEFSSDITETQGAYFYFGVAGIRYSPFYTYYKKTDAGFENHPDALPTYPSSFSLLATGEYISLANASTLELVVPPLGKEYLADQNKILNRSLSSFSDDTDDGLSFDDAVSYCSTSTISIIKGSQTKYYTGKLINQAMWDLIASPTTGPDLNHNSYDANRYAHWLDKTALIPTEVDLYGLPEPEAYNESGMYEGLKMWYIKEMGEDNQVCHECPVPVLKGRNIAYDGVASFGWTGFINAQLPFGQARCYYILSP